MTRYGDGVRSERIAEGFLRSRGYYVVRAAGSHGVDLAAIPGRGLHEDSLPLLVEVKSCRQRRLRKYEDVIAELRTLADTVNAHMLLAIHWVGVGWMWLNISKEGVSQDHVWSTTDWPYGG